MWRSSIGRIAVLYNDIEDQAAFAGRQVELVAVLDLTAASGDDVSVRLAVRVSASS
jgi:hypothetical protein